MDALMLHIFNRSFAIFTPSVESLESAMDYWLWFHRLCQKFSCTRRCDDQQLDQLDVKKCGTNQHHTQCKIDITMTQA